MKTIHPKSIRPIGAYKDPIKEILVESFDRYNKIRDGIMLCFKDYNIPPILMYRMASELDFLSMNEYQQFLINYCDRKIKGEQETRTISWESWEKVFDGFVGEETKITTCWKKIIEIMKVENVKVLEIARIAPEIKTSAMENFINALGNFIEEQTKKSEEKNGIEKNTLDN